LAQCVKVQEGDAPPEDPAALLAEVERVAAELLDLVRRINRTNAAASFEGGTLADALALRDALKLRRAVYADTAEAAVVQQNRYSKSEVKYQSTVEVAALRRQADDLARQYRELDTRIQEANWRVELAE